MGMAASIPYFTVDELDGFPDDGNRYELLDGVLLVTPAPSHLHQVIATRLAIALSSAPGARVVNPGVVPDPPRTQLEPDVLVYPARFAVNAPWVGITEHWLAVEIYSASSKIYDRDFKRAEYARRGVLEVWLVDTDERTVAVHRIDGTSELKRDRIAWTIPEGGGTRVIELEWLFEGVDAAEDRI